jgi:hypothetical protein
LKTVADDFPFIVYPKRYAIGTLGRRNPSDLIANLRECCRCNANRVDPHEEKDLLELERLAKTKNRRRVSFGAGCEIQVDLQKTGVPMHGFSSIDWTQRSGNRFMQNAFTCAYKRNAE